MILMVGRVSRANSERGRWEVARDILDTALTDQIGRGESLHAGSGILVGLAGVMTTIGTTSSMLPERFLGRVGLCGAGVSAVLAVAVLLIRRPGRQPVDLKGAVDHILATSKVESIEDTLLTTDLGAAGRNDRRLRAKGILIVLSSLALAVAVVSLVAGSIAHKAL
ncbi:MAG TPA: hypothetical protein VK277_02550 [Acidimicrobiales bacterium]|nr:hypothetical protein [Acidimicrobiales bacterium]